MSAERVTPTGEQVAVSQDEGMNLSDAEAVALALYLAGRHLRSDWLEWGDVPNLGEHAFERLERAIDQLANELNGDADQSGYDPADLHERATA